MWPLTASEVARACAPQAAPLPAALAAEPITHAETDSRHVTPGCLFVAIRGETFDGHDFVAAALAAGARMALVDAAWAGLSALPAESRARCLAVPDVIAAYRGLAAALRQRFPFPVFGVGGSNGKTTTKEILAALLSGDKRAVRKTQKSENGFLGIAQTINAAAKAAPRVPDALVLEIGIDAVGAMAQHAVLAKPAMVMLTALEPEHVAGFGTSDVAAAEEFLLFTDCPDAVRVWQSHEPKLMTPERLARFAPRDVLVVEESALDEARAAWRAARLPDATARAARTLVWQAEEDTERRAIRLAFVWGQGIANLAPVAIEKEQALWLPLLGRHNAANFALAVAAASAHGVSHADMLSGLGHFQAPPQRSNIVDLPRGIILIDDSYNASPASMRSGLALLARPEWRARPKFLFLGDMAELGAESRSWHEGLAPDVLAVAGARVHLFGDEMAALHAALAPRAAAAGQSLAHLPKAADPTAFLASLTLLPEDAVILVKGSRSMRLERLVAPLAARARA